MEKTLPPRRLALASRARATLLWAAILFLLAQAGLHVALTTCWPLRDPEYGRRLTALRARQAERGPGRPLVLLTGSSRVAVNVRPGLMEVNHREGGPTVFNFALCRAGPMLQLQCVRRLLDDGVRPDLLLAEMHYATLPWRKGEEGGLAPERLAWSDVRAVAAEYERPGRLCRTWARAHAVPWHGLNSHLLAQWAPSLLDEAARRKCDEWAVDGWGWLSVPVFREDHPLMPPAARRKARQRVSAQLASYAARGYPVSAHTRRMLAELTELCRSRGIRLAFLLVPDVVLPRYSPAADRNIDESYGTISRELRVPVVDLRDGAVADDFVDGAHMTDEGAARFTSVLEAELRPLFEGRPLEERWPAGQVRPTAEARRRLAQREAGGRAAGDAGPR